MPYLPADIRSIAVAALLLLLSLSVSATLRAEPSGQAAKLEPWADDSLPVKEGLAVWLDATRQTAAWDANGKALAGGDVVDVFYDASGRRRDFAQPLAIAQPRFLEGAQRAAVRFDGKDDHLRWSGRDAPLGRFTVFIVASARSNEGKFRAFLAANETGKNDYTTGFNIDMGPHPSDGMAGITVFNVEGRGHVGLHNLLKSPVPFEEFHVFTVTSAPGAGGVELHVNGKPGVPRDRAEGTLSTDNLVLAARIASNIDAPPFLQGFLDGDVAELLLYDRRLNDEERGSVEAYLSRKHEGAAAALARQDGGGGQMLQLLDNPPQVQMFSPGFTVRALPLDLTNINNLRYRDDGKLLALAYDGNVYLLADTDGDGLEDKADLFWNNEGRIKAPVGMALTPPGYPHGRGMFVPSMGKLSLIVDTDGDDRADREIIVADGWPKSFVNVDATGVTMARDGSVYFGIGTANFVDPLMIDKQGQSHYDLRSERGTIVKVAPNLKSRQIVCTGIRFPIGIAFNPLGDLFCTDQEGATWVPNGNPFDELLHIQPGRHYGFPPRHPRHLPGVIDEPSTFDYAPQHQSTCGLLFNEPVNGGPTFGPAEWRGDAIVCGSSRGKIYRTRLTKSPAGYVARNQLIGSIPMLLIDACVSPAGDLVLCAHGGNPDWGTGPTGKGKLYKISYQREGPPQPVLCWPGGPGEVRIAFDRALDHAALAGLSKNVTIHYGPHVGAGDRFEKIRPGYAIVKRQVRAPRGSLPVLGAAVSRDGRTLVLTTAQHAQAAGYAVTLPGLGRTSPSPGEVAQLDQMDLAYDLTGVWAEMRGAPDAPPAWSGWLPHPDLSAARAFTAGSAQHDGLWPSLRTHGRLTLRTSLDLWNMLRPAVQPGSRIDHTPPPETVTVTFESNRSIELRAAGATSSGTRASMTVTPKEGQLLPLELVMQTGESEPTLTVSFTTNESDQPRPMPLRRFLLPWAKPRSESIDALATTVTPPELKGGDWLRGRQVFFGNEAGCAKCHAVRGQGSDLGPDLSNLIHRDYESVMRDIREPSGALNPDYVGSTVAMKDGRVFHGIMRTVGAKGGAGGAGAGADRFVVRGDYDGERSALKLADVQKVTPSPLSVMPTGLAEGLGAEKMRDLLTFLLTEPLAPAPIERKGAPPPRTRGEVEAVMGSTIAPTTTPATTTTTTTTSHKPMNILLVAGPKDHGPSEHDYPAWQKRWATLLGLADDVTVEQANEWPSPEQWEAANVAVFYSANPAWTAEKATDLDAFLARGGGLVFLHYAVNGRNAVEPLAERIGLASRGGGSKFRHGAVELRIRDTGHPITRGFDKVRFVDETYWDLAGDATRIHVLADAVEEGAPRPQLWTREHGNGRVVVNILGHYAWTFDDPLFRLLLLRSICWSAREPVDRLSGLATIGARINQ